MSPIAINNNVLDAAFLVAENERLSLIRQASLERITRVDAVPVKEIIVLPGRRGSSGDNQVAVNRRVRRKSDLSAFNAPVSNVSPAIELKIFEIELVAGRVVHDLADHSSLNAWNQQQEHQHPSHAHPMLCFFLSVSPKNPESFRKTANKSGKKRRKGGERRSEERRVGK